MGGIAQLLSPSPKFDIGKSKNDETSSTFSGARNTQNPGVPVPIVYGELIVGSHLVSVGIENIDVELDA